MPGPSPNIFLRHLSLHPGQDTPGGSSLEWEKYRIDSEIGAKARVAKSVGVNHIDESSFSHQMVFVRFLSCGVSWGETLDYSTIMPETNTITASPSNRSKV